MKQPEHLAVPPHRRREVRTRREHRDSRPTAGSTVCRTKPAGSAHHLMSELGPSQPCPHPRLGRAGWGKPSSTCRHPQWQGSSAALLRSLSERSRVVNRPRAAPSQGPRHPTCWECGPEPPRSRAPGTPSQGSRRLGLREGRGAHRVTCKPGQEPGLAVLQGPGMSSFPGQPAKPVLQHPNFVSFGSFSLCSI